MLPKPKLDKLSNALKAYCKTYLNGKIKELDESGTRIMVNDFLKDVLGYQPIEEIKTEYMIRGSYADYVIQIKNQRHFLVEVKALNFDLVEKHLRQAVNYGANEGIEWALLTNGKQFDFYKILFTKPIDSQLIFSINLNDTAGLKKAVDTLQFIHREAIVNKGLLHLGNKTAALDTKNIAGLLFAEPVVNYLKRALKDKYDRKFTDEEITHALTDVVCKPLSMELIKVSKPKVKKVVKKAAPATEVTTPQTQTL